MLPEEAIVQLGINPADMRSWEVLYGYLRPRLLGYALVLLADFAMPLDLADDLAQEALLKFIPQWRLDRSMVNSLDAAIGYLKKSIRNSLIDRFRQQRRHPMVEFLDVRFDEAFGSEAHIHRNIYVRDVLGKLTGDCAKLLKRYVQEGLTLAELADAENVPPKTFYSRWYRCLEQAQRAVEAGSSEIVG